MDAIALIDCNNFYCSAERVFDARLAGKAVGVLSNNDGCIISRSNELKSLNVPMGAPHFKWQSFLESEEVEILSSNYELYGDMSSRVMTTLSDFTPEVEVYSIDEAFLGLQEIQKGFNYLGKAIQETVYKHTGIPVGVGIAETKTLSKVANKIAKKSEKAKGVLDLYKSPYTDIALQRTPIGDVWGIGRASQKKLESVNVGNALQFKKCDLRWVKKNFTVTGGRTLLELNGIKCLPFELTPPPKKSITCSRSLGEVVTRKSELLNAVSYFLNTAVSKMRFHKLAAQTLTVFAATNRFRPETYYADSYTFESAYPSDNLFELQTWAGEAFERIWKNGHEYKKAGITLGGLIPREGITERLFVETQISERHERLNLAMDEINKKHGRDTVRIARARKGDWQTKADRRSPRYTTRFDEILRAG